MFKSLEVKYPKFYQVFRFIIVIIASVLYAWNLRCFAKVADLLPGGFSGVSLLFQAIGLRFFYISIPFTIFNVALNIFPAYIAYRYIGKKFTIYSIVVIILSSVLVDILPPYIFTEDILLISVFGGIINGFAISLCLNVGTTTGGTDFISIYFSHIKGIDAWNYILLGNVVILLIAGGLFGWSIALYSIIYQFCSTQVIQFMYKRYQKMTLFIISDKSEEIKGIGCYEEKERTLIYSVINSEAKRELITLIRSIDKHAFINVVKTEELDGRFNDIPHD